MALVDKSLILYGYEVTPNNKSLDFRAVSLESPRAATLRLGFYSSTSLAVEIKRALQEVDPLRIYTVTINRTIMGGTQNRMTISTNGGFFELLFFSGPRVASSCASLIGFNASDYIGSTTYTGSSSTGIVFQSSMAAYNYLSPDFSKKVFGNINVSASGLKETIVFQVQRFWQAEFQYESEANILLNWTPFMTWAIQQKPLEFTPEVSSPNTFFEGTLEKTTGDSKGLGYFFSEMIPNFPNFYRTGLLTFRVTNR